MRVVEYARRLIRIIAGADLRTRHRTAPAERASTGALG